MRPWTLGLAAGAAGLLLLAWWTRLGSARAVPSVETPPLSAGSAAAAAAAAPAAPATRSPRARDTHAAHSAALPARVSAGARAPASARADAPAAPAAPADAPAGADAPASAPVPVKRYDQIADLTQTDPLLDLPGGGNSYCGPVAVSNSLVALAGECPGLLPPGEDAEHRQAELVRQLSSHRYMATSPIGGTGAIGMLEGLERYLAHHGCAYRRLAYQGWRGHPPRFSAGVRPPPLDWLGEALSTGGAAWINVGWYRPTESGKGYRRHGGHWLTVVAVGVDAQGQRDPAALVLHDPAPYAGASFADEYVRAEPLDSGWLVDGKAALPARGYQRLGGGMHIKREGEVAIIDGAMVLLL